MPDPKLSDPVSKYRTPRSRGSRGPASWQDGSQAGPRRDELSWFRGARRTGSHRADQAEKRIGLAIPGDLRDATFCRELVAKAVQGLRGLDTVVNNAGRQQIQASILDITNEEFDYTMKTNICAPF